MTRETLKRELYAALFAAFALALFFAVSGIYHARHASQVSADSLPPVTDVDSAMGDAYAKTFCWQPGDYGVTVYRFAPELDSLEHEGLVRHEQVHRQQLATHCTEQMALIVADSMVRLAYEAPAYCAQMHFAEDHGAGSLFRLRYEWALIYAGHEGIPLAEVLSEIVKVCPTYDEIMRRQNIGEPLWQERSP